MSSFHRLLYKVSISLLFEFFIIHLSLKLAFKLLGNTLMPIFKNRTFACLILRILTF